MRSCGFTSSLAGYKIAASLTLRRRWLNPQGNRDVCHTKPTQRFFVEFACCLGHLLLAVHAIPWYVSRTSSNKGIATLTKVSTPRPTSPTAARCRSTPASLRLTTNSPNACLGKTVGRLPFASSPELSIFSLITGPHN